MLKLPFTAIFTAPGFQDHAQFFDATLDGAALQAENYARQPWKDWPYVVFQNGQGGIRLELSRMCNGYYEGITEVTAVCPPIPVRDYDYLARFKDDDPEKLLYEGWGSSPEEALKRLLKEVMES